MGDERMLDDDMELELEDLDEESDQDVDAVSEEAGVPDTDTDRDSGETESDSAEAVQEEPGRYERALQKGSELVENLKGKADSALDRAIPMANDLISKHKGKFFQAYDTVMDLKDEMHYARKDSGGGWKGIKSAAGVLKRHVKESDAYKKFMDSPVGQGIQAVDRGVSWTRDKIREGASQAVDKFNGTRLGKWIQEKAVGKLKSGASWAGNKIKAGASQIADKFNGSRLGKWIKEKKENPSDEPGFFSKAWNGIKSGASWAGNKIKAGASQVADKFNGTRLGKWIKEKRENPSDEPGFFSKAWNGIKSGAGALAAKALNTDAGKWVGSQIERGKNWAGQQKEWLDSRLNTLRDWKSLYIDEALDNHEHERRIRFMERQGDSGYGMRYKDLVSKLGEMPGIKQLKGMINEGEIEEIILELEEGEKTTDDVIESVGNVAGKARNLFGKKSYGNMVLGGVQSGAGIITSKRLSNDLAKMQGNTSNENLSKGLRFAKAKADKDVVNHSFDMVTTGVSAAGKLVGQKTAAKVVNAAVGLAQGAVTSSMDKKTRKASLKGILGGVEGYKQMKATYKLKAPEMRRAIRQAIGVSTEDDVVNMDRMSTSQEILRSARDGDQESMDFAKRVHGNSTGSLYKALGGSDRVFRTQKYETQEA